MSKHTTILRVWPKWFWVMFPKSLPGIPHSKKNKAIKEVTFLKNGNIFWDLKLWRGKIVSNSCTVNYATGFIVTRTLTFFTVVALLPALLTVTSWALAIWLYFFLGTGTLYWSRNTIWKADVPQKLNTKILLPLWAERRWFYLSRTPVKSFGNSFLELWDKIIGQK